MVTKWYGTSSMSMSTDHGHRLSLCVFLMYMYGR